MFLIQSPSDLGSNSDKPQKKHYISYRLQQRQRKYNFFVISPLCYPALKPAWIRLLLALLGSNVLLNCREDSAKVQVGKSNLKAPISYPIIKKNLKYLVNYQFDLPQTFTLFTIYVAFYYFGKNYFNQGRLLHRDCGTEPHKWSVA